MCKVTHFIFVFLIVAAIVSCLHAQRRVAITAFKNQSGLFALDQWEQSIPELLQSELSQSPAIIVLERRKLRAVLEEHALAMSGLTDSSKAREIGSLLNAEYLISGSIHKISSRYHIEAALTKVSTGESHSEKAVAPDMEHLDKMVALLANNILFNLTGTGNYREQIKLKGYPTTYFLAATVGLAVAAGVARSQYEQNLDEYHNNTQLDEFQPLYDKANRTRKLSVALATAAGTAFLGTLYCWIRNRSPREIYAHTTQQRLLEPYLTMNSKNGVFIGAQIRF